LNASVNLMWIDHYLGELAPIASANANLVLFLLLGLVFGIGMANTQIFVALACGANRPLQSRRSKRMACGTKTRWSSWR
jgi:hypothetical protein